MLKLFVYLVINDSRDISLSRAGAWVLFNGLSVLLFAPGTSGNCQSKTGMVKKQICNIG